MADALVASMELTLIDAISGPLTKIQEALGKVRAVTDRMDITAPLRKATEPADALVRAMSTLGSAMERANLRARELGEQTSGALVQAEKSAWGLRDALNAIGGAASSAWGKVSSFGGQVAAPFRRVGNAVSHFGEAGSNLVNKGFGAAMEGFAVYEPIKQYAEWDETLRRITVMQGLHGGAAAAQRDRLSDFFRTDALATGQTSEAIAHAFLDLVGQGFKGDFIERALRSHSMAATAYGITPEAMGQVVGSLFGTMGLQPEQLGGALASMAKAAQSGKFSVSDFSSEMPGIFGAMSLLGMKGRGAADVGFATAEIVRQFTGQSGSAGADIYDALRYITSPIAARSFAKKAGVDLPGMLRNAEKAGINPLDAIVDKLRQLTSGMTPVQQAEELGKLLHNQQAALAFQALIQHFDQWRKLRGELGRVDESKLAIDFAEQANSPAFQLHNLSEGFAELTQVMGRSFMPVLTVITRGVLYLTRGLEGLEKVHPLAFSFVGSGLAGLLAVSAGLGILGAVVPLVARGFGLLVSFGQLFLPVITALATPFGAVLVLTTAFAAAALDIYTSWDKFSSFFVAIWDGVKHALHGAWEMFAGFWTFDRARVHAGWQELTDGIAKAFSNAVNIVERLFGGLGRWIDSWSDGIGSAIANHLAQHFNSGLLSQWTGWKLPTLPGTGAPGAAGAPNAGPGPNEVHLKITTDPGTHATVMRSAQGVTTSFAPNRGQVLGRP